MPMPVGFRSIAVDAGRLPIHIPANHAGATLFGIVDWKADRVRAEGDARIATSAAGAIFGCLHIDSANY